MAFQQIHKTIHSLDKTLQLHNGGEIFSLNPMKKVCTSYEELFDSISFLDSLHLPKIIDAISKIVEEEIHHFPNNIFWDKDYFFFYFLTEISNYSPNEQDNFIATYVERYVSLLQLFGKTSLIRFQYLHDFTYGFDWAKWVRNDSERRKNVLPFSLAFLERMYLRGKELEQLIQKNDELYPSISKSEFRNPFQFQRSIEGESLLFRQLATNECIPIIAWEQNGSLDWKKNYTELREQHAKNCGLST